MVAQPVIIGGIYEWPSDINMTQYQPENTYAMPLLISWATDMKDACQCKAMDTDMALSGSMS